MNLRLCQWGPETQDRVRNKRIKAKGAWGFAVVMEVMESFEGAGAASRSHGLFRYPDKSRNQTCVSRVSGFAGDSLPTEPLGKQSVYINKFGKTVLNIFLTDTHCPLALGNYSRYDFSIERQYVSWYHGNHFILPADKSRLVTCTLCEAGCWLSLPPLWFGDKNTI